MKPGDRVRIKSHDHELTRSAFGYEICPEDLASCGCVLGDIGVIQAVSKWIGLDGTVIDDCYVKLERTPEDPFAWALAQSDLELVEAQ